MAYDASKEKQEEYGLITKNSRGEYFRITRVIPGDNKVDSIDIRLYYTDGEENIRPTQKGVRVSSEIVPELVLSILRAMNEDEITTLQGLLEEEGIQI